MIKLSSHKLPMESVMRSMTILILYAWDVRLELGNPPTNLHFLFKIILKELTEEQNVVNVSLFTQS